MSLSEASPDLDEFLVSIGEAGVRRASIEASERAADTMAIYIALEHAETASHYESMDLGNGGQALGLPAAELRGAIAAFIVQASRL
jgi:hypothetical protein